MKRKDAEHIVEKVVEILEEKRISQKITKLQISKETGLSRTAITLLAKKKNSPTLRTLLMIASCLDVDLKEIIQKAQSEK